MPDIYFQCGCGKSVAVAETGVGQTFDCPDCGQPLTVPAPDIRADCPHCGTAILAPGSLAGKNIQCANCRKYVQIMPKPEVEPPAPAPSPAAPAAPAAASRKVAARSSTFNFLGLVKFVLFSVVFGTLLVIYLNNRQAVNSESRAVAGILDQESAAADYQAAMQSINAALSNYPKARNRVEAKILLQRLEQAVQVSNALTRATAIAVTNLGLALEDLIQAVHHNPLALNRSHAEARLSQMRMTYAEKLMTSRTESMEAMTLAETMRSVQQMNDLPLAIKMLENTMEDCPGATNRTDAARLLAKMQIGFNQTEALSKAMAEAESKSHNDLRQAIDFLQEALNQNAAAVNRAEADALIAGWKRRNIEAAIVLQKQENDSIALAQAVAAAQKAQDLKVAVQIMEDALRQYPDATNRMAVTAIIARIARGERPTGARAGFGAGLALSPRWHYGVSKGARAADDMQALLGSLGEPNVDTREYPSLVIYKKVTYLMPLDDAVKALFLEKSSASKSSVTTPGFPENSLFYYAYPGIYEENFNRLLLVTDGHNQVVAAQLVEADPQKDSARWDWWGRDTREYILYDLIQNRAKSSANAEVRWKNMTFTLNPELVFDRDAKAERPKTHILEGRLAVMDGKEYQTKERTRIYLPQPIVNLILFKLSGQKYAP